jgi:hypothetical protein
MNTEIETLTEEFEQILSSKVDTKIEEAGYTKNVEEWIEFIENSKTDPLAPNEYICDYTIAKNAKAFAIGPVFSYMGKVHACSTSEYNSLKDLKDHLNGKKYIVYCILCRVVSEPIGPIETRDLLITFKDNFSPIDRIGKNPKLRYTFRGHILNDT